MLIKIDGHFSIKGALSRDFRPLVFFNKQLHLGPDPWVKAFLHFCVYAEIFNHEIDFFGGQRCPQSLVKNG
jgi:hypothetical protein